MFSTIPKASGWKDYVAAYQALYTNATLAKVEQSDIAKQQELTRVGAAIGKDMMISQLQVAAEIDYKRAQVLGFEGRALVQLAFLSSTGEPLALCIIRSDEARESTKAGSSLAAVQQMEMEGMSSAAWSGGGYEFLLIGGKDAMLMEKLAQRFQREQL